MNAYLPKLREPSTSSAESGISDNTTSGKVTVNGLNDEEDPKKCRVM
jgi:hypothetical protein